MTPDRLEDAQIDEAVAPLLETGWTLAADRASMSKTFVFGGFVQAFGWMTQVAIWAEKLNHHPDWANSWREVRVTLSTHDAGGLTERDVALARRMDKLAAAAASG
ncbi:MAG: 4a-hydroxytetrahydrobiopterin dehydratase [Tranquillimonas sp.]|jgi:4a-hydroxytetrahydrobiopterin dehydratase